MDKALFSWGIRSGVQGVLTGSRVLGLGYIHMRQSAGGSWV